MSEENEPARNASQSDAGGEIKNQEEIESTEPESEVLEFEFNDDGEEDLKKTLKKFRADLKECKKQKEEYLTGWQKERADFVNYKKEEGERNTKFKEIIQERILENFLSVMDSFDMAFSNKEAWGKVDATWRTGVEYIYSQMSNIFEEYGITSIGQVGEKFNPEIHQSVEIIETIDKSQDNTIAQVLQKGYKTKDKVIRAARVKVFGYKE